MYLFKQIFRNKWLSAINIIGLSIGLAVSIMLLLFVTSELSYDKHFANRKRIVSLNTVWHRSTGIEHLSINMRRAYTDLPEKVAGVEACTQIYRGWSVELIHERNHFQNVNLLYVDPEFFKVFELKFVEGVPQTALTSPKTLVITRHYANLIFGSTEGAMGKTVSIRDTEYTIDGVVEQFPPNTHFSFGILADMMSTPGFQHMQGLEFQTFYLIDSKASVPEVRRSIEQTYSDILSEEFTKWVNAECYGETELLTDIYLFSKADFGLGKRSDIRFVLLLAGLSLVILLLAITNFMNLFLAQGETRMGEIGVRKANGAGTGALVKQFFSEVSLTTMVAFIIGFALAIYFTPYFSKLVERKIELTQLGNLWFIVSAVAVFVLTVFLSAAYPSFYLSRFKPLDVLSKRISFGKRRLTTMVIIFQSAVTIILISYVLVVNRQTVYMKNSPAGYNPKNVMMVIANRSTALAYESLRQELQSFPDVKEVSSATHTIGGGCSGQTISSPQDAENVQTINQYRVMPGYGELMEVELIEGRFFNEDDPNNATSLVLNHAAVRMLGIEPPYAGKEAIYNGRRHTIIGVTKDFCYDEPGFKVMPLMFNFSPNPGFIHIRFHEDVSRATAVEVATEAFRKFDSEYVLNPRWSEDIYNQKFEANQTHSKIILLSSLLSILIATMGLLAVQTFVTVRRTKEIGVRRVHGSNKATVFLLLTVDLAKWIVTAGVIAIPIAWWLSSNWLNNYADKVSTGWIVFVVPIIVQCLIIALVIWGVTYKVLSASPVKSLKSE
ncbi:MAG: ABC transporter permease [Bacteroidales bacterium]|nr:ABC transporter permease [Bacteroidales bacterium]